MGHRQWWKTRGDRRRAVAPIPTLVYLQRAPPFPLVTLYTRLRPGKLLPGLSLCHSICCLALSYSSKHSPAEDRSQPASRAAASSVRTSGEVRAAERRHSAVDRAFIKQVGFGSRATGNLDPASLFLSSDASTDSTAAAARGPMLRTAQRGQRPPHARNARSRLAAGSPRGTAFPRLTAPH